MRIIINEALSKSEMIEIVTEMAEQIAELRKTLDTVGYMYPERWVTFNDMQNELENIRYEVERL